MIHIATVHWKLDAWIDIQLKYLHRHIHEPFRVYAYLNRLTDDHSAKFFYSSADDIESHAVKLNLLARHILDVAADDDLLIFIDGDAFPIADIIPYGEEKLRSYPLLAVQRRENFGDIQPHPSFCMTTVGFWRAIGGDWEKGCRWRNSRGEEVTDVGGNLLGLFEQRRIAWYPLLRSNKVDLHPLFFGIYDDVVYHHGAGFRSPHCRLDDVKDGKLFDESQCGIVTRSVRKFLYKRRSRKTKQANKLLADRVFADILSRDTFYEDFL